MRTDSIKDANVAIYSMGRISGDGGSIRPRFLFDVENFRDPQGVKSFKDARANGKSPDVRKFVMDDPRAPAVKALAALYVTDALKDARSTFVSIGFKDQKGVWIAPAMAEEVADHLSALGFKVLVRHHGIP